MKHMLHIVLISIFLSPNSCYPTPITEIPQGTFHIRPSDIPEELDTDDLVVTVNDGLVVFHWVDAAGEDHEIIYSYNYGPPED